MSAGREGRLADVVRLQEIRSLGTGSGQTPTIDLARDLGAFHVLTVQVRKCGGSPTGTMWLAHSPSLVDSAFEKYNGQSWDLSAITNRALVFTGLQRYVRWIADISAGSVVFVIDAIVRQTEQASAAYFALQGPTTLSGTNATQAINQAIDVLGYRTLSVQTRKLKAGNAGEKLYLQHAPVLDEAAFEDVTTTFGATATFDLATAGNQTLRFTNLMRFVRWRGDYAGGAVFSLDVIARGT